LQELNEELVALNVEAWEFEEGIGINISQLLGS
jgi:hypothetical protein